MKKLFLIALIAIFTMTMASCVMFPSTVKKEAVTAPPEVVEKATEAKTDGILIKINKKDKSQAALVEAVQVLEKLYSTPLVLVSGGTADTGDGTKVSIVRYSLYFKVSSTMYTVVLISNGMITEIMSINNVGGKVLATKKMRVSEVLEVTGITEEE